jgi:hypothetical protein
MTERDYICSRLANLASVSSQRHYITHATKDEYLLPEELLENAHDCIRRTRTISAACGALPEAAVQEILALEPLLLAITDEVLGSEHLVDGEPAWICVRHQAARCLQLMGFDLAAWEKGEGLTQVG